MVQPVVLCAHHFNAQFRENRLITPLRGLIPSVVSSFKWRLRRLYLPAGEAGVLGEVKAQKTSIAIAK